MNYDDIINKMDKTVGVFENNLAEVRAGRANPAILNKIKIDYYGVPTPISQVAGISVPEARLIVIQPWDLGILKEIENFSGPKGIQPSSSLQTCPSNSPFKTAFGFFNFTFCTKVTSPSNEVTSTPNNSSNLTCFFPTSSTFPISSMSLFFSKRNSVSSEIKTGLFPF